MATRKKTPTQPRLIMAYAEVKDAVTDAVEKAKAEGVDAALVGGFAMRAYGSKRLTEDIDLAVTKLPSFARDGDPISIGGTSVKFEGVEIDFIKRNDEYKALYSAAISKAKVHPEFGVKVVSPEYLVAMKMVAGRQKDELDLYFLLSSVKMNAALLKQVVTQFLGAYGWTSVQHQTNVAKWMKESGKLE
jgi:hypothetical protein